MEKEHSVEPVEIFNGSLWEAEVIQGLLNTEGIETYVQDDHAGTIAPWRMVSSEIDTVKLLVANLEASKAKQIIAEYRQQ